MFLKGMGNNIKNWEKFNESSESSEMVIRRDLVGKPYDYRGLPQIKVVHAVEFKPSGTFGAVHEAEKYLKEQGYSNGSMQRDAPIGFADSDKYEYISKWWNMSYDERNQLLDGAYIPLPQFREGGVLVLWFKLPKFMKEKSAEYFKKMND